LRESGPLTLEEFEGPRYQRISHIKKLMADGIISPDLRVTDIGRRGTVTALAS
jgi:hypothetical protein